MNKIIQCPACHTKFAINESQLQGVDNPKFHCSRCSHIFSLDIVGKENTAIVSISSSEESIAPEEASLAEISSSTALDLLRSLKNNEKDEEFKGDLENTTNENNDSWKLDNNDEYKFKEGLIREDFLTESDIDNSKEESQLSLFAEQELISESESVISDNFEDTIKSSNIDYSKNLKGYKASWDNTNPDLPYEANVNTFVSVSSKKNHIDSNKNTNFDPELTSVFSRDSLNKEFSKVNENNLPVLSQTDKSSFSKSEIDKEVDEEINDKEISEKALIPLSKQSDLRSEDAFKTEKSEDLSNLRLRDIVVDNDLSDPLNRSMQHTTVIKRDEITKALSLQKEDYEKFIAEDEQGDDISLIKRNSKSNSISSTLIGKLSLTGIFTNASNTQRSFLIAWSLPFFMMLVLCFWAYSINEVSFQDDKHGKLSSSFGSILGLTKPLPIKAPPQGVSFSPINAKVSLSQDSTKWLFVRGFVLNSTDISIPSLEVISLLYDSNHTLLDRHIAYVPNSLNKVNLSSFKDSDILKNSENIDSLSYPPHSSRQVILAMEDIHNSKWFATRVYAAKF